MNASSKHVYDSDKEVKGRENKFYLNRKFKQFDTGKEESGSSSYLSLSGHDSGVTWQSSMSYVSVDGTGTLSDISSGYLSVDENQDSEYDDSCNSGNNCFSCILDGIVTEATHMCHTCLPERQYICHKCLKQHNKFCDGHDVISLSVKCEQRTEPKSNSLEQTYNSYDRYDQAVPLKAKNIHKHITDLSNQKDKMQKSGKKTFYKTVTMDHKKYSEHQLTISPKQSVVPSTDSTDELKRTLTHMVAKPVVLSTDYVPLRHFDKASQTEYLDELKKNELPLEEKPCDLSLFSTDNDSLKNKDGEGDIAFQEKAPSKVRNKNKINQCHLQKDRPVDRRKVKASFTDRNKNKRNQCHLQKMPELEKEIPHTDFTDESNKSLLQNPENSRVVATQSQKDLTEEMKHLLKEEMKSISNFTEELNESLFQNLENPRVVSLLSTTTEQLARKEQFHKVSGLSKKDLDRVFELDVSKTSIKPELFTNTESVGEYLFKRQKYRSLSNAYGRSVGARENEMLEKDFSVVIHKEAYLETEYLYDNPGTFLDYSNTIIKCKEYPSINDVARILFEKMSEHPETILSKSQKDLTEEMKHSSKQAITSISGLTEELKESFFQNPESLRVLALVSTITQLLARIERFHKISGLSKKDLDRVSELDVRKTSIIAELFTNTESVGEYLLKRQKYRW